MQVLIEAKQTKLSTVHDDVDKAWDSCKKTTINFTKGMPEHD